MPSQYGTIVLMGSGELTATMVEVHKSLIRRYGHSPEAVFLDTPAGFQLNADHIAQKAMVYFNDRVQRPLQVASFKSAHLDDTSVNQRAFDQLRKADYLLIGPGSPTYALQQWQQSPIPQLMIELIKRGGCLVAASAAALTIGAQTLPVYEIYKVGMPLHWMPGMDILGHFGLNLVVMPHWNNAEGGNHDTRFCFMGAPRLSRLESLLETPTPILGIDEHTALIINLATQNATIEGVGKVTLRYRGHERSFGKNDTIPVSLLQNQNLQEGAPPDAKSPLPPLSSAETNQDDVWITIHQHADKIRQAMDQNQDDQVARILLDLERHIWQAQRHLEELNEMGAARELLREMIAMLAAKMALRPASHRICLAPLVDALLQLRKQFRDEKKFEAADALRNCLQKTGIQVKDGPAGPVWEMEKP